MSAKSHDHVMLEIRRQLHDPRGRKAAVMVGAGFSRNARHLHDSHATLPDWRTLTTKLAARLYPDADERQRVVEAAGATSSALRLAAEFEVEFGRPSLVALIRETIRDDEYVPGGLHHSLLELPWADVFTTNYDRLLERTSSSLWRQYYEIVRRPGDLPLVRRPRIIKLHGSLPDLDSFVLTEDDYRQYPRTHAPFVAAVQASLSENILCLIGFSGEDPNFLAWTGWLRDEMKAASPSAYLFTMNPLKPFQQQLLRRRNIVPMALSEMAGVGPADYSGAYSWLFSELSRPVDAPTTIWNRATRHLSVASGADFVEEPTWGGKVDPTDTAIQWRAHRLEFKGWHVLPKDAVERLRRATVNWMMELRPAVVNALPAFTALFAVREYVWRCSRSLQPLQDTFVFEVIDPQIRRFEEWRQQAPDSVAIVGTSRSTAVSTDELDEALAMVLCELLRHSREIADDRRFDSILEQLRRSGNALEDVRSYATYQQVLREAGRLRYDKVHRLLEEWNTASADPIWAARRGAICLESGLVDSGTQILEEALRRVRAVPPSDWADIKALSAEGILLNLLRIAYSSQRFSKDRTSTSPEQEADCRAADERQIVDRLNDLALLGCDPSDLQEWFDEVIDAVPRRTQGEHLEEGFALGSVKRTLSFGGTEKVVVKAYSVIRFIEDAAVPLAVRAPLRMTVAAPVFASAMRIVGFFATHEAVGLFMRSRDEKVVSTILTRAAVEALSRVQVESVFGAAKEALQVAITRLGDGPGASGPGEEFWEEQLIVACAVLGRLVGRVDETVACSLLQEISVLPTNKNLDHRWRLRDPICNLTWDVADGLSKAGLERVLPDLIASPVLGSVKRPALPHEAGRYRDPVGAAAKYRWKPASELAERCGSMSEPLIAMAAKAEGAERQALSHRLWHLNAAGLFDDVRASSLAEALYFKTDVHGLPADCDLLDTAVLFLPQLPGRDERAAFRSKFLNQEEGEITWRTLCRTGHSSRHGRSGRSIEWTADDVGKILERAEEALSRFGTPEPETEARRLSPFGNDRSSRPDRVNAWHDTLRIVVLRGKRATAEQRSCANDLIARAEGSGWRAISSLAARVGCKFIESEDAIRQLIVGITSRDATVVAQACEAVLDWADLGPVGPGQTKAVEVLASVVSNRRHKEMPLLLQYLAAALRRVGAAEGRAIFADVVPALRELLVESKPVETPEPPIWTAGQKLGIRVACVKAAAGLLDVGFADPVLNEWLACGLDDPSCEVRRAVDTWHV